MDVTSFSFTTFVSVNYARGVEKSGGRVKSSWISLIAMRDARFTGHLRGDVHVLLVQGKAFGCGGSGRMRGNDRNRWEFRPKYALHCFVL